MLHSICQQIWKTQQWPQDWKRSVFIPIPKKGNAKGYSNYCTIALISHASKVMSLLLTTSRDQIANICWIMEKAREFQKNIYFCFIDYAKAFVKVLHSICQQIWKTHQWPEEWKMSVFIPIPKKGNAKNCSNYHKLHSFHMLAKKCLKLLMLKKICRV